MNKLNFVFLAALVMVLVLSSVSAYAIITGTVYEGNDLTKPVPGADVFVQCAGNERAAITGSNGSYNVTFFDESSSKDCTVGTKVGVLAYKDGMWGVSNKTIEGSFEIMQIIIGLQDIDVPLIPEFGFIAGTIAIEGAVGLFFFVRRK